MFSKRRQPKTEFFGIIRNIFSNNGSKATKKTNNSLAETKPKDKNTLKKMVKSKLSLVRIGSMRYESKGCSQEYQSNIFSPTSNLNFDEVDLSLSSIMKDPHTSIVSHKKKLRFDNNVTQQTNLEDLSLLTQHCGENEGNDTKNQDKSNDTFNESDDDYYKKMKNDLLARNKKAPFPKPKRAKSFKKLHSEIDDTDIKQSKEATQDERAKNVADKNNSTGRVFNSDQIKKWQDGFTDIYNDTICRNIFESENMDTEGIINSIKNAEFLKVFEESSKQHTSGKMASSKSSKKNRYDPISRNNENCGVALLKKMDKDNSRMSWCSVSSF